jgi:hypothetical protein
MKRIAMISGVAGVMAVSAAMGFARGKEDPAGNAEGRGGIPADFREVIHTLFAEHDQVKREVKVTREGYEAETTTADAKLAMLLQTHVGQMKSRLESGMGVRHWDPAFVEIRAHYEDMAIEIEDIEGGVRVKVKGKTPDAVKVAQNHAKILSGFVERGPEEMHAEHAAVLGEGAVAGGGAGGRGPGKGGCGRQCAGGNCQGQGQGQGGGEGATGKARGCGGKCRGKGGAGFEETESSDAAER